MTATGREVRGAAWPGAARAGGGGAARKVTVVVGSGGPGRALARAARSPAGALALLGAALAVLLADAPRAAAEDFTFRRVAVPRAGATDRITVQIDPSAPRRVSAPWGPALPSRAGEGAAPREASRGGGGAATPAGVEWFWAGVSPLLADSGPGRLAQAIEVMAEAPQGFAPPRLQGLQDIAAAHGPEILRATVGTRVSPALVLAVISVESAGRVDAVSSAGAAGLMQLMPATAERFGVADRLEAGQSIRGGVAYLDWLLGRFGGDPILALAAYNAGEGAVDNNGGVPPYAETRAYVPKVLAAWTVARGLCLTPPDLIGDGCVFAVGAS